MPLTQKRLRRVTAAFLALQTAKGTLQDVFTPGMNSSRLWTVSLDVQADRPKREDGPWMNEALSEGIESRSALPERCSGSLRCVATPEIVSLLLRSNWGPPAGASFSLKTQVNEWFTLAWVEETDATSTQKVVRVRDAFFHRLSIRCHRALGKIYVDADFSGTRNPAEAIATSGITLPPEPMGVSDVRVFPSRGIELRRDPGGENVNIPFSSVDIVLDQQVLEDWYMSGASEGGEWDAFKGGKTKAILTIRGPYTDETWAMLNDSRIDVKRRFSLRAPSTPSVKTLEIDMRRVSFEVAPTGHDEEHTEFDAQGIALVDTGGEFVEISLT